MARNLKLFFDSNGAPRARGPSSEKILMAFLEADVQGSDHICHDLMEDLTAIEDNYADSREFIGNAHSVVITSEGVTIECIIDDIADDQENDAAHDETTKTDTKNVDEKKQETSNSASDADEPKQYKTALKHFREVLEDWEAFILDDQSPA